MTLPSRTILLMLVISACQQTPAYLLADTQTPHLTPEIYAEELINKQNAYVGYCTFSNDALYYGVTNQQWDQSNILILDKNQNIDTLRMELDAVWVGEPRITPDNKYLYFTAIVQPEEPDSWHSDFYFAENSGKGWTKPKRFSQNSAQNEWHISFTNQMDAYFGSERQGSRLKADIYYSKFENGAYQSPTLLPEGINTEHNDCDPVIAYDESYLIFHSDRPGGYGQHDLYISFNQGENEWSEPVNMGNQVNTEAWEMGPTISSDGKYLFFTRRNSWNTSIPSSIYWVDIAIINSLREQ